MRSNVGARGFEPPTCRRGDRSTVACQVHPYLAQSCNIARVVLPRSDWQNFRFGLKPTALHVLSLWNHQRYGGECAQSNSRKSLRSVVRSFGFAPRSNKTFLDDRTLYPREASRTSDLVVPHHALHPA